MESSRLIIETRAQGAELTRIYDKENKREVLWDAKPDVWAWHSPFLFPFIAKCYNEVYHCDGVEYPIASHGFGRNFDWEKVSETENEVWYTFSDNEKTREIYPFGFRLETGYRLEENCVRVMWRVTNTGDRTLHYCIGAHPAFWIPQGIDKLDCFIRFAGQTEIPYITNDFKNSGCAWADKVLTIKLPDGKEKIGNLFEDMDTYIFEHGEIKEATLLLPDETPFVTMHCEKFPQFGFWHKKGSEFVCLEPWYGRCDNIGFTGDISEKACVQHLEVGGVFSTDYVIEVH